LAFFFFFGLWVFGSRGCNHGNFFFFFFFFFFFLLLPSSAQSLLAVECDVSSEAELRTAADRIEAGLNGAPSVLVNCAGITRDGLALSMSRAQFAEVLDVNLTGVFLASREFGARMARDAQAAGDGSYRGSVVNIASIVAKGGNVGQANYAAAKAGVVALTKTTAQEWARCVWRKDFFFFFLFWRGNGYTYQYLLLPPNPSRYSIRSNAVLPGFINTPIVATVPDKVMKMMIGMTPMRRMGEPEEIAEVVAFLASHESSYMTGATVEVTGGLAM
jgi:17beta-estradiol 17-dehydrogenase/3alpha(17beta)-hydroxysteroid dehydrogenase (NAD+)